MMNRINKLFGIKYPIVQGGMVWNSGWRLASAVSNCGGLGLLGAGSMRPDILLENITKCKKATDKAFGVNIPMLYPDLDKIIDIVLKEKIEIVFTSAGNPKTYTEILKKEGVKVVHVVSSLKFALKCQEAGVDAIVAEGFEAGGHNGKEETTTLSLIPNIRRHINLPLIAAGGISLGAQMKAVMLLGADGVQIGSRFAATFEASSHDNFKQKITEIGEGETKLTLKELSPVRLIKNNFFSDIEKLYENCADKETLKEILGKGRAKLGMFEGNLEDGELEIGQSSALIDEILSVEQVFHKLLNEFKQAKCLLNL